MVFSLNMETPIYTPKHYNPHYGDPFTAKCGRSRHETLADGFDSAEIRLDLKRHRGLDLGGRFKQKSGETNHK